MNRQMITVFLACAAGNCVANTTWWMQPYLMQHLVGEQIMSEMLTGILISLEMTGLAFASALSAKFIHHNHTLVKAAVAGTALAGVVTLISLLSDSIILLFASRVLAGIGAGITLMVANRITAGFADPDRAFAQVTVVNVLFGTLISGILPYISIMIGNYSPFPLMGVALILLIPFVALFPKTGVVESSAAKDQQCDDVPLLNRSQIYSAVLLCVATFGVSLSSGLIWPYYAIIGENSGLTPEQVGGAISIAVLCAAAGSGLSAVIGSHFGRLIPVSVGLIAMVAAILTLSMKPSSEMFYLAACVNVGSIFFAVPYLFGAGAMLDASGRISAYVGSAFFMAGAVSPALAGVLSANYGLETVGKGIALMSVVIITCVYLAERRNNQRQEDMPLLDSH